VAAWYDSSEPWVYLKFDRAVHVDGFDAGQVTLLDGTQNAAQYVGGGPAVLIDSLTVQVTMEFVGPYAGDAVTVSATASTGIVAADDGAAWGGVTDLVLPFP
jgi:hypothetical protein